MLPVLVHLAGVANFAYAAYTSYLITIPPEVSYSRDKFGGTLKYLTYWNVWLQMLYYTVCLANDLAGSNATERKSSSGLQRLRDHLFASLAFPVGFVVAVAFWTLWAIDRNLVMPATFDPYIPFHLNHMLHTTVVPLLVLELCLVYHVYPQRMAGMATTAVFLVAYLVWILIIAYFGGFWVYPVLKKLDPVGRTAFIAVSAIGGAMLYGFGELCNRAIWGKIVEKKTKRKNK